MYCIIPGLLTGTEVRGKVSGKKLLENKREPTLQANSKLGLCYTPYIGYKDMPGVDSRQLPNAVLSSHAFSTTNDLLIKYNNDVFPSILYTIGHVTILYCTAL